MMVNSYHLGQSLASMKTIATATVVLAIDCPQIYDDGSSNYTN